MFQNLFRELRKVNVPVSIPEYLDLISSMDRGLADYGIDEFYHLSRTLLIKDERHLDRFDQVFSQVFKGIKHLGTGNTKLDVPEEWLKKLSELHLNEEEKKKIEALGGWEKLLETLHQRMAEQEKRHERGM